MDIKTKLKHIETAVKAVAGHDDEDAAVRHAALDQIDALVKAEREAIDARVAARVAAALK